jgi:CubicO group peptidase (beta-lactamase class C family)
VTTFKNMKRRAKILTVLICSWVVLAVGGSDAANAAAVRAAPAAPRDALDRYMASQMKKARVPGAQVTVVRAGKIVALRSYGLADIEKHVAVNNETVFGIASITKAFIGVVAMQLVEQGKLDLAAPVSRYIDGLPTQWQSVTLRQLFNHVSGLPDLWDHFHVIDENESQAWAKVKAMPMLAQPGTVFRYTQTNYVLLGQIISKLSGVPFTNVVAAKQLDVVTMPGTAFGNTLIAFGNSPDLRARSAARYTYYDLSGAEAKPSDTRIVSPIENSPAWFAACNGMMSTAEDLARWIVALQQGKLLTKASLATLWTPGVFNDGTQSPGFGGLLNGYAVGWETVTRPQNPAVAAVGGDRAALFIYPEDDLAVVVLTNLMGSSPDRWVEGIAALYRP